MDTVLYILNASEVIPKNNIKNISVKDSNQLNVETIPLSVSGEKNAEYLSKNKELNNIDSVYCSNFVSAISTAKYIAIENNCIINVDERLNERKVGQLSSIDIAEFNRLQLRDANFKLNNGESLNQTKKRITECIKNILMFESGNRVAVVTHNVALTCLLSAWCEEGRNYDNDIILTYNDDSIIDGKCEIPMLFKVVFDGMIVTSVERIDLEKK